MKENKLMSMCDFVMLKSDELIQFKDLDYIEGSKKVIISHKIITNYAQFLQQTLELWMFVPCELVDDVWAAIEWKEPYEDGSNMLYKQAQKRVLFEGFEVDSSKPYVSILGYGTRVCSSAKSFCCRNIEELIGVVQESDGLIEGSGKTEITLTKTALKQIEL